MAIRNRDHARTVLAYIEQTRAKALEQKEDRQTMNEIVKTQPDQGLAPGQWQALREQAKALVASGFLPKAIKTDAQAIAIMLTGRELGIGPMHALRSINVIEGKPCLSAELLAGLVYKRVPGALLRIVTSTDKVCEVEAGRPEQEPTTFAFTIADAQTAGLTAKDNWKKYPRAMLRSRCIAEAARAVFPDATAGIYDPDEMGAITDESGNVIETTAAPPKVSPFGEAEPGKEYASSEERDIAIAAFGEAETLEDLKKALNTHAWVGPEDLEEWHPDDAKAISKAYKARERILQKTGES